jgi:hypothetical protein
MKQDYRATQGAGCKTAGVIPYLCPWAAAALSPCSGYAPALLRSREKAEEVRLDVPELSATSACSGRRRARRIGRRDTGGLARLGGGARAAQATGGEVKKGLGHAGA